jgi:MFS transporter, FSR family, fosmidomycin resistance protein
MGVIMRLCAVKQIEESINPRALSASNLIVYGITHAVVDASCAALLFSLMSGNSQEPVQFAFLLLLYNTLAFALQAPLGFMADYLQKPAVVAASGCLLTAFSLFARQFPIVAICLAGVGNALFHVGGGTVSLNLKPGKSSMPGIFVAPGALGLAAGTMIGKSGYYSVLPFLVLLMAAGIALVLTRPPEIKRDTDFPANIRYFDLILVLLLVSITIRSLLGLVLNFPWKADMHWLVILTLAVFMGKALGGVIADHFGWTRVAVMGLLLAAPLISFGLNNPWLAIPGVLLFNMTMPVTLTAVSNMLPGRAGFSFGLTTLALIVGALPSFTSAQQILANPWVLLIAILFSAFLLYKGLTLFSGNRSSEDEKSVNID